MCWNKEISLNTFVFSSFVLALIFYNNTYTQYKIKYFDNSWYYILLSSIFLMQLVESFIWRNIHSTYNQFFSIVASILLLCQPIISLMLIDNKELRHNLILIYVLIFIPYFTYKFMNNQMKSSISEKGHLVWSFLDNHIAVYFIWIFFFLFSFMYRQNYYGFLFAMGLFLLTYYNYYNDKTIGSMWCWIVNSIMIYFAAYLLLYLPFIE